MCQVNTGDWDAGHKDSESPSTGRCVVLIGEFHPEILATVPFSLSPSLAPCLSHNQSPILSWLPNSGQWAPSSANLFVCLQLCQKRGWTTRLRYESVARVTYTPSCVRDCLKNVSPNGLLEESEASRRVCVTTVMTGIELARRHSIRWLIDVTSRLWSGLAFPKEFGSQSMMRRYEPYRTRAPYRRRQRPTSVTLMMINDT